VNYFITWKKLQCHNHTDEVSKSIANTTRKWITAVIVTMSLTTSPPPRPPLRSPTHSHPSLDKARTQVRKEKQGGGPARKGHRYRVTDSFQCSATYIVNKLVCLECPRDPSACHRSPSVLILTSQLNVLLLLT